MGDVVHVQFDRRTRMALFMSREAAENIEKMNAPKYSTVISNAVREFDTLVANNKDVELLVLDAEDGPQAAKLQVVVDNDIIEILERMADYLSLEMHQVLRLALSYYLTKINSI